MRRLPWEATRHGIGSVAVVSVAAACLLIAGCDPMMGGPASRADAASDDVDDAAEAMDATPRDAPPRVDRADVPAEPDVPRRAPESCGEVPVLDADDLGESFGRAHFLQVPREAFGPLRLRPGDACLSRGLVQTVVRYVPRTDSVLRMAVVQGESLYVQLSLWVYRRCAAGAAEDVIACNGRSLYLERGTERQYAPHVRAGEALYIAMDSTAAARFTVSLTEVPDTLAEGDACEVDGRVAACASGLSCQWRSNGERYRCLRDGVAAGRPCREAAPRCDAGLTCVALGGVSLAAQCVDERALNEECTRREDCPTGICRETARGRRCVSSGAAMTLCRIAGRSCDDGLVCDDHPILGGGRCAPGSLPPGARCDLGNTTGACAEGYRCLPVSEESRELRCIALGTERAPCRASPPLCDTGLTCSDAFRCRRALPLGFVGGQCRPTAPRCDATLECVGEVCQYPPPPSGYCRGDGNCAPDQRCAQTERGGVCTGVGVPGGWCRATAPRCDGALLCNALGYCARPGTTTVEAGGIDWAVPCPNQGRYVRSLGCVPPGEENGYCRSGGDPCAPGLRCAEPSSGRALAAVCGRVLPRGASCDASGIRLVSQSLCEAGTVCQDLPRAPRVCAVPGSLGTPCDPARPGGPCEAGAACVDGLCARVSADGTCDYWRVVCPASQACVPHEICRPLASLGARGALCRPASPRCDAGLFCLGYSCVDPADPISACDTGGCHGAGNAGEACRPRAPSCAAGLECNGRCRVLAGLGEPCAAGRCRAPLECTAGRCAQGPYDVTRSEDAPWIDVCGMPARELPDIFPMRLFGEPMMFPTLDEGNLRAYSSAFESCAVDPMPEYGVGRTCVRVEGSAPARRLLLEQSWTTASWAVPGPWVEGTGLVGIEGTAGFEVVLEEATGVIEVRFRGPVVSTTEPPFPLLVSPTVRCGERRAGLFGITVRRGTSVRFVPRS